MTVSQEAHEAARKIKPLGKRILCRYVIDQKIGSIWMPGNGGKALDVVKSEVVAIGTRVTLRPWELAIGDHVLHVRTTGLKYDHVAGFLGRGNAQAGTAKDADYVFLFETDILATCDPNSVVTGSAQYSEGRVGEWKQGS